MGENGETAVMSTDGYSSAKPDGHTKQVLSKLKHRTRGKAVDKTESAAEEAREKVDDVAAKTDYIKDKLEGKVEGAVEDIHHPLTHDGKIHPMASEYAATVGYAMAQQIAAYLHEAEGQDVLNTMFLNQAAVVGNVVRQLLLSEDFRRSCRMVGSEVTLGSADSLEKRVTGAWKKLPKFLSLSIVSLVAVSGWLLLLGLTLSLWRFAVFGL